MEKLEIKNKTKKTQLWSHMGLLVTCASSSSKREDLIFTLEHKEVYSGEGKLVQLLSHVRLSVTPWTTSGQALLSITYSRSPPKPMSIESMMPSNHLILCRPLLLLPSIFSSISVFSNESALHIRWPEYWSFSFNISPSNEYSGLIFRMDWLGLLAV